MIQAGDEASGSTLSHRCLWEAVRIEIAWHFPFQIAIKVNVGEGDVSKALFGRWCIPRYTYTYIVLTHENALSKNVGCLIPQPLYPARVMISMPIGLSKICLLVTIPQRECRRCNVEEGQPPTHSEVLEEAGRNDGVLQINFGGDGRIRH